MIKNDMDETKYDDALTIAIAEIEADNLPITDIDTWSKQELVEWLELRGFEWHGDGWEFVGETETPLPKHLDPNYDGVDKYWDLSAEQIQAMLDDAGTRS